MRQLFRMAAVAASIVSAHASASTVLYNAALGTGPTAQGLVYGAFPIQTYYASTASSTLLNTSLSNSIYAGFGTSSVPLPHGNFTVRVDARIVGGSFTNPDRSAFDIIAIDDTGKGIELAFHTNEIFSLGAPDAFARVDVASYNTSQAITRYDLAFTGNTYTLSAAGSVILAGAIRDYSAASLPPGLPNPYITPNSIFIGDDTTSAGGASEFSYVAVVPEPGMVLVGAFALLGRRRGC